MCVQGILKRLKGYLLGLKRQILLGLIALLITDLLALLPPWMIKDAIDSLPYIHSRKHLFLSFLAIVGTVALQALFRFLWRRYLFGVSREVEYRLRTDLFAHLLRMSKAFFTRFSPGDLVSRSTNDLTAVQELIGFSGLLAVDTSITLVTCIALMLVIDPGLTTMALLPLPFLSISFLYFGRQVKEKALEVQRRLGEMSDLVQETLSGIRVVKAYGMEEERQDKFRTLTLRYMDGNLKLATIRGLFYALLGLTTGLASVLVLWLGGARVVSGALTLGEFVAFNSYLTMLAWPMMSLGFMVNLIQRGSASMGRLDEILLSEPLVADTPSPVGSTSIGGEVTFRRVSFIYPGGRSEALRDIDLLIPAGTIMALTGSVGCGKSTLLSLIPRIYDVTAGSIALDGVDIREMELKKLRSEVGYVPQEPFIFSGTIEENILMASNDGGSRLNEVIRIAKLDDLMALPKGLGTPVGERGVTLSGGQRQRLALARELMKSPRVLLLDDAFSHLDAETEAEIMRELIESCGEMTILLVSHRVSTLKFAYQIAVMHEGRIVEQGTHDELTSKEGTYLRIVRRYTLMEEITEWRRG